jgi:ADP-ribose pyrophosphatase YjhB (NUDIX family)
MGVGVVIRDEDKILLIQRGTGSSQGIWSVPGGLVELGEKIHDAAIREVKEETGLDVEIGNLIDIANIIQRDNEDKVKYHYVVADFLGKAVGGKLHPTVEAPDARWVKSEELVKYRLTASLLPILEKIGFIKKQK